LRFECLDVLLVEWGPEGLLGGDFEHLVLFGRDCWDEGLREYDDLHTRVYWSVSPPLLLL
jgi:hypothetical protein